MDFSTLLVIARLIPRISLDAPVEDTKIKYLFLGFLLKLALIRNLMCNLAVSSLFAFFISSPLYLTSSTNILEKVFFDALLINFILLTSFPSFELSFRVYNIPSSLTFDPLPIY